MDRRVRDRLLTALARIHDPHRMGHSAPHELDACPLCASRDALVGHKSRAAAIVQCARCGLVMRSPQPSDERLQAIYGPDYFFGSGDSDLEAATSALKSATADLYLDAIAAYRASQGLPTTGLTLLDIGCGHGDLMASAKARGYDVHGTDVSADAVQRVRSRLGSAAATCDPDGKAALPGPFDVCVLSDVIEHARDPRSLLLHVRTLLKPDGTLFISTPSVSHWQARLLGRHWMEFKEEHLFYFDPRTLRMLVGECGYGELALHASRKALSLDYVTAHFRRFPVPLLTPAIAGLQRLMPATIRRWPVSLPTGGLVLVARPAPPGLST